MGIYIVAHGTVNGYQKISSTIVGGGSELFVLTDIRTEFDNTNTMLTKKPGYLLQMSPTGVWISIAKPFIDGERSGNGAGFFAFSAFIPKNLQVEGKKIKEILDGLMDTYLDMCPGFMTRNINVDWSFVAEKAKELSGYSKQRTKNINVDCSQLNKFAYVIAENDERVIQFLDKPFQFEFGSFKAVFIGTHLQHPMRLTMQEKIDIDFEDELYDIVWKGDVGAWPNLERKVRKKEIATKSRFFEKKYYHSEEVKFSEGTRDENNTTLTLEIPKLTPEINELKLTYKYPEVVKSIRVNGQNQVDKNKLSFKGDEFAKQIRISLDLQEGYQCKEFFITPSECSEKTYTVYGIIKIKKINICVVWNGSGSYCDEIKKNDIEFKKRGSIDIIEHTFHSKCNFSVCIPENDDFEHDYEVFLKNSIHYRICSLCKMDDDNNYVLNIEKRQQYNNSNIPSVLEKQKEKVYIKTKINTEKIKVNRGSISIEGSNGNYYIEIPKGTDINTIDFRLKSNDKKLRVEIERDEITLSRPFVFEFEFDFDRKNILFGIVIVLVVIVLSIAILLVLDRANIVDVMPGEGESEIVQGPSPSNSPGSSLTELTIISNELDTIVKIQRTRWIYEEIKPWVENYKDNEQVRNLPSYKELFWLMKSRFCFNGYYMEEDTSKTYEVVSTHDNNQNLNGGWAYALVDLIDNPPSSLDVSTIANFLQEIINAGQPTYKNFFETYIKTKTIENKTLEEVKALWNNKSTFSPANSGRSQRVSPSSESGQSGTISTREDEIP